MKPIIKKVSAWISLLPEKQAQWSWFILLWCCGLGSVMVIGYAIRWLMGID